MKVLWVSGRYKPENVKSVYARLINTNEVKFVEVNLEGASIREWVCDKLELENIDKLIGSEQVLWSGLSYAERQDVIKRMDKTK
jgi:hypothetical protein